MTPPRAPARPLPWVFAAVIGACALVPPETDGAALAGVAGLIVLAVALVVPSEALPLRAWLLLPGAGALALAARCAQAPGSAVLPAATAALAVAAGLAGAAAARGGPGARRLATFALASSGAFVGGRALYEALYGLRALAERVRADAASVPSAEAVLGRLEQGRAYAGFPTPAAAGGFLALAIPVTFALAAVSAGRRRWLLGAAGLLQVAGLVATRSLTAAAALLVALGLAAAMTRSRRVALAAAAIVVAIAALAALRAGQVFSRSSDDSPWVLRMGNVRIGLAIAADHPWKGVGPGGYAEAFARYRAASDNEARHAHCLPVELLADLGIPLGLVAGVGLLAVFLGPIAGTRGAAPLERGIAIGVAAFAVHNLGDFTAYLPSVLLPAVLLRATLVAPAPPSAARAGPGLAFLAAAAVAGGIVALSGGADARVDAATRAAREGRLDAATSAASRAGRLAPWSVEAALVHAQAEASLGRWEEALRSADRAVALVPVRASIRDVRAQIRLAGSDAPGALADLSRAVEFNPRRPEYAERRDRVRASLP